MTSNYYCDCRQCTGSRRFIITRVDGRDYTMHEWRHTMDAWIGKRDALIASGKYALVNSNGFALTHEGKRVFLA